MNEWKQGAEAVVVTGWDKRSGTRRGVPGPSLHIRRVVEPASPPQQSDRWAHPFAAAWGPSH